MRLLYKIFEIIYGLLLYYFSFIIKKDKNVWVFGAWFGKAYNDNSRYLFEYVSNNLKDIKAIWLSTDKEVITYLNSLGYKAYHTYSLKGIYYSLKAYFGVVITGKNDINRFVPPKYYINLWHGTPLKKIVYDDKFFRKKHSKLYRKIIYSIFMPYAKHNYNKNFYITARGELEQKNLASAFNVELDRVWITGLMRDSILFNSKEFNKEQTKIIYLPTHRNQGTTKIEILSEETFNKLDKKLKALNARLYIKLHFYHLKNLSFIDKFENIIFIKPNVDFDLYYFLKKIDILITDYSSVFFDFLITQKPIIFFPYDLKDYLTKDRELYYDYNQITPGPKCKNWEEVFEWIEKFKTNPKLYEDDRKAIFEKFYKFKDDKAIERVLKCMKSLL